jgi:predicted Zn-dependent protease
MKLQLSKIFAILFVTTLVSGCGSSPTGRNQLKLFSEAKLTEVGAQAFADLKSNEPISSSLQVNRYVQCVASAITQQVSSEIFAGEWEIVVFDKPDINAFALPGGKIGVYTGLLNVADNADQLAAVIGHEVGHVIAGHGNERASSDSLISAGLKASEFLLKRNNVSGQQQIMQAIGFGSRIGIALPYGRIHETEADEIGLELMTQAGFTPEEAVELWKNMSKNSNNAAVPQLLSTHPSPETRIENLQERIKILTPAPKGSFKPTCD